MSWLDLYNFLYHQANDIRNLGKFDWNSAVVVHDANTGDEHYCDTYLFDDKLTLAINMDSIILEKGQP